MSSEDIRMRLPLQLERKFRPWSYHVTQRRFELRSDGNFEFGETVYVTFFDVFAMQVRRTYERLQIAEEKNVASIEKFAEIPERHSHRYMRLSVGDGIHEGFLVCVTFQTRIVEPEP